MDKDDTGISKFTSKKKQYANWTFKRFKVKECDIPIMD